MRAVAEADAQAAYEIAIDLAEQEYAINPSSWETIMRLGLYYAHTERADDALAQLNQALGLSGDETAYYFASIVSLSIGNRARAIEYVRESLRQGFSKSLILADPDLKELHGDTEFAALLTAR